MFFFRGVAVFIIFICKRSTVVKIIRYLRSTKSEEDVGNQREKKEADVKTDVAKHLLHLFNNVNIPIIDNISVKKNEEKAIHSKTVNNTILSMSKPDIENDDSRQKRKLGVLGVKQEVSFQDDCNLNK